MFAVHQCAAVIPCYNEAPSLGTLVSAVRRYLPTVIVVDDGSIDATAEQARAAGAVVLPHPCNRGKGAALQTGFAWARSVGYRWAVTLDGDGQHNPHDLPVLFDAANTTEASLIIGNRMGEAHAMPWLRRQVNWWMSRQLSRRAHRALPDTQSGYRLLDLDMWAALNLKSERFEIESEMLMACLADGRSIQFVPVHVVPGRRRSRINPIADTLRWWRWWRRSPFTATEELPPPSANVGLKW